MIDISSSHLQQLCSQRFGLPSSARILLYSILICDDIAHIIMIFWKELPHFKMYGIPISIKFISFFVVVNCVLIKVSIFNSYNGEMMIDMITHKHDTWYSNISILTLPFPPERILDLTWFYYSNGCIILVEIIEVHK